MGSLHPWLILSLYAEVGAAFEDRTSADKNFKGVRGKCTFTAREHVGDKWDGPGVNPAPYGQLD